jgi:hypothetical protein
MGEVYQAKDTRLGGKVAMKILPSAFLQTEFNEKQGRFLPDGQ